MPTHSPYSRNSAVKATAALALLAIIGGCAQPQESAALYDTTRENTQRDAQSYAMGTGARAPSQIQLGFGETGQPQSQPEAGQAAKQDTQNTGSTPRPLATPRSFLGTVPCPAGANCDAARFVVTLAPGGEWRSRTTLLVNNQAGHVLTEQGCWEVIGESPLRIALIHVNRDTAKADLSSVNNNTLRVVTLNGVQPMLEHRLTRQADLDPIDELKDRPALNCQ